MKPKCHVGNTKYLPYGSIRIYDVMLPLEADVQIISIRPDVLAVCWSGVLGCELTQCQERKTSAAALGKQQSGV